MAEHTKKTGGPRIASDFDRELNFKVLIGFLVVIAVVTIAAFWGMWMMGVGLQEHLATTDPPAYPLTESADGLLPPLPRLQTESYADWATMLETMETELASYAWADREAGKVRIPIEEAMRRVAESGLPEFPTPPSADPAPAAGSGGN